MNLCWIVPGAEGGHVRDVDTADRVRLMDEGYEEFRLVCETPSGTQEGGLFIQACKGAQELASQAEKGGLALFGGCTTAHVHRPDSATTLELPLADLAALNHTSAAP